MKHWPTVCGVLTNDRRAEAMIKKYKKGCIVAGERYVMFGQSKGIATCEGGGGNAT